MHHKIVRTYGYNNNIYLYLYYKRFWFLPWIYQTLEGDTDEGMKKLEHFIQNENTIVARYKNGKKI